MHQHKVNKQYFLLNKYINNKYIIYLYWEYLRTTKIVNTLPISVTFSYPIKFINEHA